MNPHREPRSPGIKRQPMPSQPLDSNPPIPVPSCVTNEDLWNEVQEVRTTTVKILDAIKGNNLGNPGILPTLAEHAVQIEENTSAIKKQKNKVAKWAAFAAGVAFAASWLKDWILHKP